jgi:hypothetical protein
MLQKWQAYHRYRQTYDATWKGTVENAWTDYKTEWEAENPDVTIPRTKHFEVMNEYIRKTFDDETPEKKQEVEDYRRRLKDEKEEVLNEDPNADYQTYVMTPAHWQVGTWKQYLIPYNSGIDKLPRTLMTVGESIVNQTGWNVSILVGGPMPREGGKLQTYMLVTFILQERCKLTLSLLISAHFGKTNAGSDFKDFLGDDGYETHIMAPFDDFLHESFSTHRNPVKYLDYGRLTNLWTGPEVCNSRVSGMLGSKENSPWGDEKDEIQIDFEDLADGGPASHASYVPNSASASGEVEKQKKIVAALLSQFNG